MDQMYLMLRKAKVFQSSTEVVQKEATIQMLREQWVTSPEGFLDTLELAPETIQMPEVSAAIATRVVPVY